MFQLILKANSIVFGQKNLQNNERKNYIFPFLSSIYYPTRLC